MRNALAHVGSKQRQMVAAAIRTAITQETQEAAREEWRAVADRLRERFPRLGSLMNDAEHDVLAHLAFPKEHWTQLHSTNSLERLNGEIKRRTDVVAIFPNEAAIVRLVGALRREQNDEWPPAAPATRAWKSSQASAIIHSQTRSASRRPEHAAGAKHRARPVTGQLHHALGHDRGRRRQRPDLRLRIPSRGIRDGGSGWKLVDGSSLTLELAHRTRGPSQCCPKTTL